MPGYILKRAPRFNDIEKEEKPSQGYVVKTLWFRLKWKVVGNFKLLGDAFLQYSLNGKSLFFYVKYIRLLAFVICFQVHCYSIPLECELFRKLPEVF